MYLEYPQDYRLLTLNQYVCMPHKVSVYNEISYLLFREAFANPNGMDEGHVMHARMTKLKKEKGRANGTPLSKSNWLYPSFLALLSSFPELARKQPNCMLVLIIKIRIYLFID